MTESTPAAQTRGPEPQVVKVAFYLWIASAVAMIGGAAMSLAMKDRIVELTLEVNRDPRLTPDLVSRGTNTLLWTFLVGAVVFGVLFVLFAWKSREGTRSARTVLAVLAVVTALFQMLIFLNEVKVLAIVLSIGAGVCMFLPSTTGYFEKLPKK
ncbi:hypothetical protein [Amycolatopsis suaedae]|uniref:Uncharacterized protein n=1 Tax=Amycolatopsis suaedae TaxID=2510978 RepID=A0A4Q7JCL0_9PSEU|nr:hypothetical protein [Amycolatopsis suaedae]RZQ64293.1 hypothetical protein EWH70_09955 [Amycolatopsis suaedae]